MINIIRREIQRSLQRIKVIIRKGVLNTITSSYYGQVGVTEDERYNDVEYWQHFGLTSLPPAGSEALIAKCGSEGGNPAIIATNIRSHRPTGLSAGEAVFYGAKDGSDQVTAKAKSGGHLDIDPGSGTVNIGGDSTDCVDYLLKGTTFDSAHDTMLDLFSAAFSAIGAAVPAAATACSNAVAGITAFKAVNCLATKGKVK